MFRPSSEQHARYILEFRSGDIFIIAGIRYILKGCMEALTTVEALLYFNSVYSYTARILCFRVMHNV